MSDFFSIKKFFKSFGHALNGLKLVLLSEQNYRFHTVAACVAILLSFVLKISDLQFILIILCIVGVMVIEIVNTAIEKLCDYISPNHNEKIKFIKDVSAGAVLLVSMASLVIAMIIFLPKIIEKL